MANDQGKVPLSCRLRCRGLGGGDTRRGGGGASHLGRAPDEAEAGAIINLVNEVLLV